MISSAAADRCHSLRASRIAACCSRMHRFWCRSMSLPVLNGALELRPSLPSDRGWDCWISACWAAWTAHSDEDEMLDAPVASTRCHRASDSSPWKNRPNTALQSSVAACRLRVTQAWHERHKMQAAKRQQHLCAATLTACCPLCPCLQSLHMRSVDCQECPPRCHWLASGWLAHNPGTAVQVDCSAGGAWRTQATRMQSRLHCAVSKQGCHTLILFSHPVQ
jgi:hypothetical protein